jgi:transposase
MISQALAAQILRLHHAEHWGVNTIATHLRVHHSTVERVIARYAAVPVESITHARPSKVDAYVALITDTLEQFPRLSAARLFGMARARGYAGGASQFRARVALLRPRRAEAYLRLRTLPGAQAQVDWAHFGQLTIGRARRPLMGFVMVLSYSRAIYLRFFVDARMPSFLAGHVGAFSAFGGVARVLLYDNLRSAVAERIDEAIRFNPRLLELAAHYRFEPRPVAIARGNEKGRVERAIRYARGAFFAGRRFANLEDLNAQAAAWCADEALARAWPQDRARTVAQAFEEERALLLALPGSALDCHERLEVRIGKTPYARFDLNDYSVPAQYVRRTLAVLADTERVRIVDGINVVAEHTRSYDRGAQIEDSSHIEELVAHKRAARGHALTGTLIHAAPQVQALLAQAAERSGEGPSLRTMVAELHRLLGQYGAAEFERAVASALELGVAHPNAVRLALERLREARNAKPAIELPAHLRARDVVLRPANLAAYDQLIRSHDDDHEHDDESGTEPG